MAIFNTEKLLAAIPSQIPEMTDAIRREFTKDGFDVQYTTLLSGGTDISITKGGAFKAILGLRSAMKVNLSPRVDGVFFDTHVGIFGLQFVPTIITCFLFWPVLITQIWGMIRQSKMDERALLAAESVLLNGPNKKDS